MDPDQTAHIGAVCSGSTLFASILNLSVMLGNDLQQTTSADDIFRCIFSWGFKGLFTLLLSEWNGILSAIGLIRLKAISCNIEQNICK